MWQKCVTIMMIPPEEVNIRLGKWGMLHKDYLEKHNRVLLLLIAHPRQTLSALCRYRKSGATDV